MGKLSKTKYIVTYEDKEEVFFNESWAMKLANDLKENRVSVQVTYDDEVKFEYDPLQPVDQEGNVVKE